MFSVKKQHKNSAKEGINGTKQLQKEQRIAPGKYPRPRC